MENIKLKKETSRCVAILEEMDKLANEFSKLSGKLKKEKDYAQAHLAGSLLLAVYSPIGKGCSCKIGPSTHLDGMVDSLTKKSGTKGVLGGIFR